MDSLDQFQQDLKKRIEDSISKYGGSATHFLIKAAPFGKMLNDIRATDTDIVWLSLVFNLIQFLGETQDPTPVHFAISRKVLKKSKVTNDRATDMLARELGISCKGLKQSIQAAFSDSESLRDLLQTLEDEKGELLPNRDSLPGFICEKNGYNLMDLVLSEFLAAFGKTGIKIAAEVKATSKERFKKFKESGFDPEHRPNFWGEWHGQSTSGNSIFSPFLYKIATVLWKDVVEKEWKNSQAIIQVQKVPLNLFNVMLTNRGDTLSKIEKRINDFKKELIVTTDKGMLDKIKNRIEIAENIYKKANLNFPQDFRFSVYEQYGIYGGLKILHDNGYSPTEITFVGILEALGFDKINKKEITQIRKAYTRLTKSKFPCYMVHPDRKNRNKYTFYDGDEPIFKIWEFGTVDLSIDLEDEAIFNKRLVLSLANPALITNLKNFYSMINSNIIAKLRAYKKVAEDDLYLLAYLLKEIRFKSSTSTDLHKLCSIMKKTEWICEGVIIDRERKRQIKDKVVGLLIFAKDQGLIKKYTVDGAGIFIRYHEISQDMKALI